MGLKVRGADTGQTHQQQRRRLLAGRGRQGRAPEIEPLGRDPRAQQGGAPGHQGHHRAAQQQAPPLGWQWQGAQGDLGDQAEAAPAAAQQPHQVVAGHVLHHFAAGHRLNPVGPQQAQANQLIPHAQVALAIAPGQAPGHQAANAPLALAWGCGLAWAKARDRRRTGCKGWIDGQPLPVGRQGLLQLLQGGARSHRDREVAGAVLADTAQGAATHHRAGGYRRSPVESAGEAGRQPGGSLPVQLPHQLLQFPRLRTDHGTMVPWRPPSGVWLPAMSPHLPWLSSPASRSPFHTGRPDRRQRHDSR